MATNMRMKMMKVVNLKATPQLLSTTSPGHYSPLPMFINKSNYCPSNKRQINITSSSSKVPCFGIAKLLPYATSPFRSTTAVVVENSIQHAAHMVHTALLEKVVVLSKLLSLAEKSSITLNLRKMQIVHLCNKRIETMQAENWEEFLETPKEIFKAFRELIFTDNHLRASLTDSSKIKLIEDPNALTMFRELWTPILDILRPYKKSHGMSPDFEKGPYAECKYTFYYGSNNQHWIEEFRKKVEKVINDQCIKDKEIRIELRWIGDLKRKREEAKVLSELIDSGRGTNHDGLFTWLKNQPYATLRDHFESASDGRFVLTYNQKKVLLNDEGIKILKVLDEFQLWKGNVRVNGFEISFIDYYNGN